VESDDSVPAYGLWRSCLPREGATDHKMETPIFCASSCLFVAANSGVWTETASKGRLPAKGARTRRVVDGHTAVHPSGRPDRGRLAGRVTLLLWPTATTPRTRRIPKLLVVSAIPHACRGDALGGLATKCAATLHANHRRPSRSHASPTIPTASAGDSHQQPRDAPA